VQPKSLLAKGIASVLSATGLEVADTEDVVRWARGGGRRIVVVIMTAPGGVDLFRELRKARCGAATVAVVESDSPMAYVEALKAGACSAVDAKCPPEQLVAVAKAALSEHTLLPVEVMHHLVSSSYPVSAPRLSSQEVEVLRALADGMTVKALADSFMYSPREMHRRLRKLYDRMGAANRTRAIVLATRWGLVSTEEQNVVDIDALSHTVTPS